MALVRGTLASQSRLPICHQSPQYTKDSDYFLSPLPPRLWEASSNPPTVPFPPVMLVRYRPSTRNSSKNHLLLQFFLSFLHL